MIFLIEAHKSFRKIQHPFKMRTPRKLGIEGNMFNMIKDIYEKSTVNIILNVEQTLLPNIRNETRMPMFTTAI